MGFFANLLVGMSREKRGEKLSAMRFIQGYAIDRILEMANDIETPQGMGKDAFSNEKRFEQPHPGLARQMTMCIQGYEHNCESALAILTLLEQHFEVNRDIASAIRDLCT